jgi:hypothetical protein
MEACLIFRPRRAFGAHIAGLAATGLAIAALAAAAIIVPTPPASAQGLFDFFFKGPRRQGPPPGASSYADPSHPGFSGERERVTAPSGIGGTFCVRLCDGRYFPLQRHSGANPVQLCNSFCPAAETQIFSGSSIDHAAASNGSRYASLRNAFAFRERVVDNCTCNGRDAYGLVTLNVTEDPSLRSGDIVATNEGFVAYNGNGGRRNAEFTPIQSYSGLSPEMRQRLAQTRITPNNATPIPPEAIREGAAAVDSRGRRVHLDR